MNLGHPKFFCIETSELFEEILEFSVPTAPGDEKPRQQTARARGARRLGIFWAGLGVTHWFHDL